MNPTQEQVTINNIVKNGDNLLVEAFAGTGKAQPLDELVLTPNGYIKMKDISIGDEVISKQGQPIKVINTIITDNLLMFNITFSDGTSVRACKDHLWEINRRTKGNGKNIKVKDIVTTAYMLRMVSKYKNKPSSFSYPYSVDLCKPISFPSKDLYIAPYHMGYFLGNGHSSKTGSSCRISIHEQDLEEIKGYLDLSLLKRESQYGTKSCDLHFYTGTNYYLKMYNLESVKSIDKFIHSDYLHSSIEDRILLLRGLMDSDGTCTNNKARFSSSSLRLIEDVQWLVRSLGGKATVAISERNDSNVEYNLQIRTPFNPFLLKRKANNYRLTPRDLNNFKSITSIEFIGMETGKCLVVDSTEHLYITKDFTVTHNSSTLRYVASQNPDKNFLVLCFNAANVVESNAHPDKPSNIFYSTIHSIAYREVVDKFMQPKLKQGYYNYRDIDTKQLEKILSTEDKPATRKQVVTVCKEIQNCLTYYCRSDSTHLIDFAYTYFKKIFSDNTYKIIEDDIEIDKQGICLSEEQITNLTEFTRKHWLKLIDVDNECNITHDTYLKLYHLRKFVIDRVWDKKNKQYINTDIVALDEAQDSNPVTLAIFNKVTKQKIVVGDRYQQLYAWRGATNAMTYFPTFTKAYLTESFRFNNNIADIAYNILCYAGNTLKIKGSGHTTKTKSMALLCRTNAEIIDAFIFYASANERVYLLNDLKPVFSQLYHINSVFFNETPKYPAKALIDITNKEQLIEACIVNDDVNALRKLATKITKQYGSLHKGIEQLKHSIIDTPEQATLTISTIHKSKGLEWDKVIIGDKLIKPVDYEEGVTECEVEDWLRIYENQCLLYVAITRARHSISIPYYLEDYLY